MPEPTAPADDAVTVSPWPCPRCGGRSRARFYGPCDDCRHQLRATIGGAARQVETVRYEPKMNVVPNQVATKD